MSTEAVGAVLVCGAGIAGIQSALDLAESGFKVYLLDSAPAIGGRMAQLDKTFPTGDCAMCILSPKLVECARNKNIEIITLADVQEVSGGPGNFKVKILQNPRYIDLKKCDACGNCSDACPVNLPSEFERGLAARKAISRAYPQAIPNVFSISKSLDPAPCKAFCPAGINVQGFVALVSAGKIKEAYRLIRERNPLAATLGRVCPHPCQDRCNRREVDETVSVRELERFIADSMLENTEQIAPLQPAGVLDARVAVVGSGPAGLTAASDLARAGYTVTLFEEKAQLGGMLRYGIPSYRLPKDVLDREIEQILRLGIEVRTDTLIAKPKDLLLKTPSSKGATSGFDAVFLAIGARQGRRLNIPGEDARGILDAIGFLSEVNAGNQPQIGPKVLVIGSDDLAMHAARCALRLPGVKSVHLACLEGRSEMPAHPWELAEALEEGVILHPGLGPTRFEAAGDNVAAVTFRACTSVFDENRRFDPIFDDTQISSLAANTVIVAVGRGVQAAGLGVELRPGGRIQTDPDTLATGIPGIFAGGDAVMGPSSAAAAVSQGHTAAEAIDAYIRGGALIRSTNQKHSATVHASGSRVSKYASNPKPDAARRDSVRIQQRSVAERLRSFAEIHGGYNRPQALSEAARCLSCGLCSECMECVQVCSAGAVLHNQQPSEYEIEVGSIILAPGIEEFQSALWKEFGHGIHPNVLSNVQFERMLSATGPSGGRVERPSDGAEPRSIAFIQCIGSRDAARDCGYCSSVCCMSALKEAMAAFENRRASGLNVSIFCSDMRTFGKDSETYARRAQDQYGIRFIRAVPAGVAELQSSKNLLLTYTDPSGLKMSREFEMVVLSAGMQVPARVRQMASRMGIRLNSFGFAETERFSPVSTERPGIYVAGTFQEPKDIPESVAQGSAAAACAMTQLTAVRGTMVQRNEYPWERDTADEPPRIGVFVCHCGHNIASVVDVDWVSRKASKLPDVFYAEANTYTCSESSQQHIKSIIGRHRLNRLVIASCSSRTHEMLFQETVRQSGLNKYLLAMTNIRDQCSWVHRDNPAAATAKAVELVSMAVARARHLKAVPLHELPVTAAALILGGGLAGMSAALNLAGQGFKVLLVEREPVLGGLLRNLRSTLEHADVQSLRRELESKVLSDKNVSVYLDARLTRISGQVGNFKSVLDVAGREVAVEHGVVIVATGGREKTTGKFLHGKDPHVITQSRLETALADGRLGSFLNGAGTPGIVMIQCVESRTRENPDCSRVCCSEAIKNAIELKELMPECRVTILGRDFNAYGFRESFLHAAVEKGVELVRFSEKSSPVVSRGERGLEVKVRDAAAERDLVFNPELVVLSTGIAPGADNGTLAGMLRSGLTSEGFFLEAHSKLRPVDLANEGQYVCGLAHSPRFIDETIAQAQATAARASAVLSKSQLEIMSQLARVDPSHCVACATCVKVCPFGAPVIGEMKKAEIQNAKCTGCGSCVAACPARTITLQHQESETVSAMIDELLAGGVSV